MPIGALKILQDVAHWQEQSSRIVLTADAASLPASEACVRCSESSAEERRLLDLWRECRHTERHDNRVRVLSCRDTGPDTHLILQCLSQCLQ